MKSKKKIILSGYFGFDNLGDEAILNYMVSFLKENNIEPIVLSVNPKRTEKMYDVKSVNRTDLEELKKTIKESDGLISGGGSLLQDKTSKKSLLYYLLIMLLAKSSGKPFYFYGQGLGPIESLILKKCTKSVLKKAETISVRDEDSKQLLQKEVGLKNKTIDVIHDPVLFYPEAIDRDYILTDVEKAWLRKKPVFLSIRPTENDDKVIVGLEKYLDELQKKNIPVVSFGFHPEQDSEFTKNILSKYDNCRFIDRTIDLETASYIIKKSSVVVGMRLHSLILSASQCTPFVGISYDPKIESFLKKYKKTPSSTTEYFDSKKLLKETVFCLKNEEEIRKDLLSKKNEMRITNNNYNNTLLQKIRGNDDVR